METQKGWPDPKKPGVPQNPERSGPHLLIDERGSRHWGWWTSGMIMWQFDNGLQSSARDWTYVGPAETPDGKPI